MRFTLDDDQRDFAAALDSLLSGADTVSVARAWAEGDHGHGLKLWSRLADLGVLSLATDASPVEVCLAFEALGRYAVPGPWVESAGYLPAALGHEVQGVATVALPPHVPYALDADIADQVYVGTTPVSEIGELVGSVDRTRRLFDVSGVSRLAPLAPQPPEAFDPLAPQPPEAFDLAALATAAQLLGCGERLLADTVTYAQQRRQFGREIGSYQALKHRLADVRIALDFARPLLMGAALVPAGSADDRPRDVSAAKVACGDAAYLASRTALQVHGAIGYTRELDLSLWITKVRALVGAWGTPAYHRARVLEALL